MKKKLRNLLVIICSAVLVPALSVAILLPAAAALSSCAGDIQKTAEEIDAVMQEAQIQEAEVSEAEVQESEAQDAEVQETEIQSTVVQEQEAEVQETEIQEAEVQEPEVQEPEAQDAEKSSLQGKTVSLLGDSITTFDGYIPEEYLPYYPYNGMTLTDVNQTWWMNMLEQTGMELLVNGSWSGSLVCGDSEAADSKAACSYRRLTDLKQGNEIPDVILVYMGANDYFAEKELGNWSGAPTVRSDGNIQNFTESYELMLQKLIGMYPDTQLYCLTLIEADGDHEHVNGVGCTIADYNTRIKQLAGAYGIPVIDLHECGMPLEQIHQYTDDGIHPNAAGAKKMGDYVSSELLRMNSN